MTHVTENTEFVEVVISSDCTCVDIDEETGEERPAETCWDCGPDSIENFNSEILDPFIERNNLDREATLKVYGKHVTWQRVSFEGGGLVVGKLADGGFGTLNGDFRLYWRLTGKDLTLRRTSHDEPMGAEFRFEVEED